MKKIKKLLEKIFPVESSPQSAAIIMTLGASMAFSPFWGLQTWLLFPLSWMFHVNPTGPIALLYLINNPWTMLPLAALEYYVGHFITEKILHVDLVPYNPSWMTWVNAKLTSCLSKYIGTAELSLWSFLLGGLVLGIIVAAITYPCSLYLFNYMRRRKEHQ